MSDKTNIQLSNSFTFNLTNTTNYVKTITLFREGTNSQNDVKNVLTSGQTNGLNFENPAFPSLTWNTIPNQPFYYFTPLTTILTTYPTINDIYCRVTGNIDFVTNNEIAPSVFSTISVPVTSGESLQIVNDRVNQYFRDFADTTNFRNVNGDVVVFNFTFDFTILQQTPLPINLIGYTDPIGVSIQYPVPDLPIGSLGSAIRLRLINTPLSLAPTFNRCNLILLQPSSSANGVEVVDLSNVSYSEIKESQNGGILDIDSLVLNIGNAPSVFEKESQLLQPFRFKKIDVNGNEYEIQKAQVLDPYQYQFSYAKVDMTDDGENFVLDGNTKFEYSVEPNTSLNITWNYVQLKNSNFGQKESSEEVSEDVLNIEELDEDTKYAVTKELSSVSVNNDIRPSTNNVSKKPKYLIPLLLGGIALYLLFNLKPNQK